MSVELFKLDTEKRNPRSMHIDTMSTMEMVELINSEDHLCAEAVNAVLPEVARCIDIAHEAMSKGGRIFYCGAGTSGRLGVLDAAECPPTYGVDSDVVIGLIAGGHTALINAVEGAEDNYEAGAEDLKSRGFSDKDVLIGIAASGRTPYVIGAMDHAMEQGASVIALVCCCSSEMSRHAHVTIAPIPGPEVITGSSRMKSGTCQKMILNMISTGVMVKSGKVYGNLMVDVRASNEKLIQRAISIVRTATGEDEAVVKSALEKCDYHCKTAIVMLSLSVNAKTAQGLLKAADGKISTAIQSFKGDDK